jgi:hypothetical protein
MPYLDDARWRELLDARAEQPQLALDQLRTRRRRPLLTDGRLFIVAADHTARGMLGVPGEPFAMADRRRTLESLMCALSFPEVDGVLASADIMEDLAVLGALDDKLAFGTMNRGGIMGASWELDDRMTAYSAATIQANGLDGGKVLLRLADDDAGTAPTLEACAKAVDECAALGLPIMVEPLPYHHDPDTGAARLLDDEDALAHHRRARRSSATSSPSAPDPGRRRPRPRCSPASSRSSGTATSPASATRSRSRADELPTWRGQNEQGMALAAVAYAKAKRRRQIMVATSSIGPGATNMVTAAGVAHTNRLPRAAPLRRLRSSAAPPTRCCSRSSTSATRPSRSTTPSSPSPATGTASRGPSRSSTRCRRRSPPCSTPPTAARPSSACRQDTQAEAYDYPDRVLRAAGARDRPARAPTSGS